MLTAEQIKERVNYLGASDAAAVLGLSRYKTPLMVWAEKTGAVAPDDISHKLPIKVGNALEDLVCDLFTEETGKKLYRVKETLKHPAYPFLAVNLDRRVVGEDAIFEAKTASVYKADEWDNGEIPQEYLIQVLHALAVTGRKYAYIAVLIGGNQKFIWKRVDRDEDVINSIIAQECDFWLKFVEPKVMPSTVTSEDSPILSKLFNKPTPDKMVLDSTADTIAGDIKLLEEQANKLNNEVARLKNQLRLMIGNYSVGETSNYTITWKEQTKKAYQVPESTNRVLRIVKKKEAKANG